MSDERFTPTKLPTGIAEFHEWAESFATIYGDQLPTKNMDSIKFALASQIMHLGADDAFKAKEDFFKMLIAGASKQVAHAVFTEIKQKQQEAAKKEQEANVPQGTETINS